MRHNSEARPFKGERGGSWPTKESNLLVRGSKRTLRLPTPPSLTTVMMIQCSSYRAPIITISMQHHKRAAPCPTDAVVATSSMICDRGIEVTDGNPMPHGSGDEL